MPPTELDPANPTGAELSCPVCFHDRYDKFITAEDKSGQITYYLCNHCGLIYHRNPIPPDFYGSGDYRRLTHGTDSVHQQVLLEQDLRAQALMPHLRQHIKPRTRVLDVGSSAGVLLDELRKLGAIVTGVEPSKKYADYQRAKKILVYPTLQDIPDNARFDVITCIHTLEHFIAPNRELTRMRRLAEPNAKLLIEVPHALYSPTGLRLAHPCMFTYESLGRTLVKNGWHTYYILPHQATKFPIPPAIVALATPAFITFQEQSITEFVLARQIQGVKEVATITSTNQERLTQAGSTAQSYSPVSPG